MDLSSKWVVQSSLDVRGFLNNVERVKYLIDFCFSLGYFHTVRNLSINGNGALAKFKQDEHRLTPTKSINLFTIKDFRYSRRLSCWIEKKLHRVYYFT